MFRVANALFLSTLSAYSFASSDLASSTEIEKITADLRQQGDGLSNLITLIVTSDLFLSN